MPSVFNHGIKPTEKPLENMDTNNLSEATNANMAEGLETMVSRSESHNDVSHGIHMHGHNLLEVPWIHKMIPGVEKLASAYHIGNFVIDRRNGEKFFESMPIYAR